MSDIRFVKQKKQSASACSGKEVKCIVTIYNHCCESESVFIWLSGPGPNPRAKIDKNDDKIANQSNVLAKEQSLTIKIVVTTVQH